MRRTYIHNVKAKTYKQKKKRNHYIPESIKNITENSLEIQVIFFDRIKWRQDTKTIKNGNLKKELLKLKGGKNNENEN